MTRRKPKYENEDRNYGKLASAKTVFGPRNAIRKKKKIHYEKFHRLFILV